MALLIYIYAKYIIRMKGDARTHSIHIPRAYIEFCVSCMTLDRCKDHVHQVEATEEMCFS